MSPSTVKALVDEGVRIDREIADKTKRLKEIKGDLIVEASRKDREKERIGTDGGGWSWTAAGSDGCVGVVTEPGRSLKDKIDPKSKDGARTLKRFGESVKKFFHRRVVYVPLDDFRARVETAFAPAEAAKLIATCEKDSETRVAFETKEARK